MWLLSALVGSPASAQTPDLTANTQQFTVSKYFYLDPVTGDWTRQTASGFAEPSIPGVARRVIFLPSIALKQNGVKFISKSGTTIQNWENATEATVATVRFALGFDGQLAEPHQRLAVLAQLNQSDTPATAAIPQTFRYEPDTTNGTFLDQWSMIYRPVLIQQQTVARDDKAKQDALLAKWSQLSTFVAALNNARFTLLIDGVAVSSRVMQGTTVSTGVLPDLYLQDVTDFQINRIKEGDFQVGVEFGFLDSRTGSIQANFDLSRVMNQVVTESRQITTASKKSGVQILGFGKRKSVMTQAIKEESRESITQDNKANTIIQMRDADESMIAEFESKFFPTLSKAQTIENHLQAGAAAKSEGKEILATAHFGYAKALQEEKLDLDVDTAGAMAALAQKDYASFIAKGVKMQVSEGSSASQFSRVLTKDVKESFGIDWTMVKTVSVQRTVSIVIEKSEETNRAFLGLCGLIQHQIPNPSDTKMVPVIIPTCLPVGGPLTNAGFMPGQVIGRIGDKIVTTQNDINEILTNFKPGEKVTVERLHLTPKGWRSEKVQVKLTKGIPQ